MTTNEPQFPESIVAWVAENPDHVQRWMNDPEFRSDLLRNPEGYGLQDDAADWVHDRVKLKGIERLVGDQPGHIVAM